MPRSPRRRRFSRLDKENGPRTRSLDDFIVFSVPNKGRGVLAVTGIKKDEAVLEYCGLIRTDVTDEEDDTYIFECSFKGKQYWIDATWDDGSLGRLINDDLKSPNIRPKLIAKGGEPHIIFYANRDIEPMEELTYSYGGGPYPWRSQRKPKIKPDKIAVHTDEASVRVEIEPAE